MEHENIAIEASIRPNNKLGFKFSPMARMLKVRMFFNVLVPIFKDVSIIDTSISIGNVNIKISDNEKGNVKMDMNVFVYVKAALGTLNIIFID